MPLWYALSHSRINHSRKTQNNRQSGLLATVATQLLGTFRDVKLPGREAAKDFLVITCYLAIFFNINATIGAFVVVSGIREPGQEQKATFRVGTTPLRERTERGLALFVVANCKSTSLKNTEAEPYLTLQCLGLTMFISGIACLVVTLITFVLLTESLAAKIILVTFVVSAFAMNICFIMTGLIYGELQRFRRHRHARNTD